MYPICVNFSTQISQICSDFISKKVVASSALISQQLIVNWVELGRRVSECLDHNQVVKGVQPHNTAKLQVTFLSNDMALFKVIDKTRLVPEELEGVIVWSYHALNAVRPVVVLVPAPPAYAGIPCGLSVGLTICEGSATVARLKSALKFGKPDRLKSRMICKRGARISATDFHAYQQASDLHHSGI